jgi:hypothetical protein
MMHKRKRTNKSNKGGGGFFWAVTKDQIHDQNIGETNWYVDSKDIGDRQNASRFCPLADKVARMLRLWWPWALEEDHGPLLAGGFVFFV